MALVANYPKLLRLPVDEATVTPFTPSDVEWSLARSCNGTELRLEDFPAPVRGCGRVETMANVERSAGLLSKP